MPTNTSPKRKRKRENDKFENDEQQPKKQVRTGAEHAGHLVEFAPSTGAELEPPLQSVDQRTSMQTSAWDGSKNLHHFYNGIDRNAQEQRHTYIRAMQRFWPCVKIEEFFPEDIRPQQTPANPYDLCTPLLRLLSRLAEVTETRHVVAHLALMHVPRHRVGRQVGRGRIGGAVGSLDVETAIELCIRFHERCRMGDHEGAMNVITKVPEEEEERRREGAKRAERAAASGDAGSEATLDVDDEAETSAAIEPSDEAVQEQGEEAPARTTPQPDQAPTDNSYGKQQGGKRTADEPSPTVLEPLDDDHDSPPPPEDQTFDHEDDEGDENHGGDKNHDGYESDESDEENGDDEDVVSSITKGVRRTSITAR